MSDINDNLPAFAGLTPQQMVWLYEYQKDFNPREAALRAGYPEDSASYYGRTLQAHPLIEPLITRLLDERIKRLQIDADWVLLELVKLYKLANVANFLTIDAQGYPQFDFTLATRDHFAALDGLSVKPGKFGTEIKVELPSKSKLLELIGRHVGVQAWKDQLEVDRHVTLTFDQQDEEA